MAVTRTYKSENGDYEVDLIDVILYGKIAETTKEYCRQGDLIGIKGRIETQDNQPIIIADKVSFLSTSKNDENNSNDDTEVL